MIKDIVLKQEIHVQEHINIMLHKQIHHNVQVPVYTIFLIIKNYVHKIVHKNFHIK